MSCFSWIIPLFFQVTCVVCKWPQLLHTSPACILQSQPLSHICLSSSVLWAALTKLLASCLHLTHPLQMILLTVCWQMLMVICLPQHLPILEPGNGTLWIRNCIILFILQPQQITMTSALLRLFLNIHWMVLEVFFFFFFNFILLCIK